MMSKTKCYGRYLKLPVKKYGNRSWGQFPSEGPIPFTLYRIQLSKKVLRSEINGAIPVAVRSKAWVYGCSLSGVTGSNPTYGIDVCLLYVLRVRKQSSLRRLGHSCRGVIPNMVYLQQLYSPNNTIVPILLCNTVHYAVLMMMNDQIPSKHVEQTKNCGIKIDYKKCTSRWSLTHYQ